MKNLVLVAAMLAFAGTQLQTAKANDRGWATAGKILTGVAIGAAIAGAVDAHASYSVTYSSAPVYCPPPAPVIVAPPRVVCAPPVVYVPPRVIVAPVPVFCAPRPVVVYRPPVVYAPPIVHVRYDRYVPRGHDRYDRHDRHDRDGHRGHR